LVPVLIIAIFKYLTSFPDPEVLGLSGPDLLVIGMDPDQEADPDPSLIKQK
jgi:hypothetical protein